MPLIASLAREIGAEHRPEHERPRVLALYVCSLLDSMALELTRAGNAHPAAAPLVRLFGRALAAAAAVECRAAMHGAAGDVARVVEAIDDDDGWPVCGWLNALKGCALAVRIGIDDPERTRWPAEAGQQVAEMVEGKGGAGRFDSDRRAARLAFCRAAYLAAVKPT